MRRPYFVLAVFSITNAAVYFWEEKMGKKQKLRLFIVRLTGILSAAYSAYYIFVIVRDIRRSSLQGLIIDALVSLLFALLAGFAFTSEVNNLKFIKVRRITFIITLLVIVLLKLRLTGRVFAFLDFTNEYALLVALYGAAFFMTLIALVVLLVYYTFIRSNMPLYPKVSVIMPLSAMILFLLSFVAEILLLVIYHLGLETNMIRTVVSRPLFYLCFIGLSAYFLYPPRIEETSGYKPPDDSEFVKPADDKEYVPPEGSERVMPDADDFIRFDEPKKHRPKGKKHVIIDDSDFVAFDESQYKPPKGTKHVNVDDSDFIRPDNTEYVPPKGSETAKPKDTDLSTPDDGSYL